MKYCPTLIARYGFVFKSRPRTIQEARKWGVTNHWTGLLDWNTGLDYWTDIFLVFTHSEVGLLIPASQGPSENLQSATKMMSMGSGVSKN